MKHGSALLVLGGLALYALSRPVEPAPVSLFTATDALTLADRLLMRLQSSMGADDFAQTLMQDVTQVL